MKRRRSQVKDQKPKGKGQNRGEEWRAGDGGRRMEEAEERMRFGSSARLFQQDLTFVGEDIGAGLGRAGELEKPNLFQ